MEDNFDMVGYIPLIILTLYLWLSKKVYDTAMYTSEHAKERYKIIKAINNLNEFFKFRKGKYE